MFRAETLKLTTVRSTQIAVIVGIVGLAFTQILMLWVVPVLMGSLQVPTDINLPTFDLGSFEFQYSALNLVNGGSGAGSVGIALVAILSIGVLAATTDYRWGGMASAALAQPRRGRILVGKVAATAAVVAIVAAAYAVVCVLVLLLSTATGSTGLVVSFGDILSTSLRGVCALVLLALGALAIGVVVRSQLAGFLLVICLVTIEPIVQGVLMLTGSAATWAQVLPLALARTAAGDLAAPGIHPFVALGILAAATAVILGAAAAVLKRRDL